MSENVVRSARSDSIIETTRLQRSLAVLRKVVHNPKFWFGLVVLGPTLLWYAMFAFRPIIEALPLSLQQYNFINADKTRFVGLENFRTLFQERVFLKSVQVTVTWAILDFSLSLITAMALSLCLVTVKRARNMYQGMIYLPAVVSMVAVALLFRIILDPQTGQVNMILSKLHLPESKWLTSSDTALFTCVLIGIWKGIGGAVIIITAGMLSIPEELYDAAAVDGVNSWQRYWHVTLPLMGHTLLLITVLTFIGSLQAFTAPFVLTDGGPAEATYTYNMLIYRIAFTEMQLGRASAAALLQFVVIVTISLAQIKLLRPRWSY